MKWILGVLLLQTLSVKAQDTERCRLTLFDFSGVYYSIPINDSSEIAFLYNLKESPLKRGYSIIHIGADSCKDALRSYDLFANKFQYYTSKHIIWPHPDSSKGPVIYDDPICDGSWFFVERTNTKVNLIREKYVKDSLLQGEMKLYYDNGKLAQRWKFKNGVPIDTFLHYYYHGQIASIGYYSNAGEELFIFYYENGKVVYYYHRLLGKHLYFREDGTLREIEDADE